MEKELKDFGFLHSLHKSSLSAVEEVISKCPYGTWGTIPEGKKFWTICPAECPSKECEREKEVYALDLNNEAIWICFSPYAGCMPEEARKEGKWQ